MLSSTILLLSNHVTDVEKYPVHSGGGTFTGEQMLSTELQNFAAFKSYCILKLGKLVRFLIKKDTKVEFSDVLGIFELLLHLKSNLAEIWNIASTHKGKKSGAFFFEKYCQLLILCQFCTKKSQKMKNFGDFQAFFSCEIGIKSKFDNIFEKNYSRFLAYMCRCSVLNFTERAQNDFLYIFIIGKLLFQIKIPIMHI